MGKSRRGGFLLCFHEVYVPGSQSVAHLEPNAIVRGALFPEPIKVPVVMPLGESVKLIGQGLQTNQVHEPVLSPTQLETL